MIVEFKYKNVGSNYSVSSGKKGERHYDGKI
jgi:hypothetical protein